MIINIVMIIKKRTGGGDAALLGDFALEPLENFRQGKARQVYLYSTFHTHW